MDARGTTPPHDDPVGVLYRAFAPHVFGYLVRLVRDRAVAEDLLQETFVRVARRADAIRDLGAARTYLFRAATNLAIDRGRGERRRGRPAPLDGVEEPRAGAPGDGVAEAVRREEADAVRSALASLAPRDRAALLLRFVHDLGLSDVGGALGITDRGAARVVKGALDRLRRRLSPSCSPHPCSPEANP